MASVLGKGDELQKMCSSGGAPAANSLSEEVVAMLLTVSQTSEPDQRQIHLTKPP
jgi:hypothetical protein